MLTINSTSNTKHGKNNSQHSCTIFFKRRIAFQASSKPDMH